MKYMGFSDWEKHLQLPDAPGSIEGGLFPPTVRAIDLTF
jgi:hypothetical protein